MKRYLNDLDWTLTGYQGEDFTFNMERGRLIDFFAQPLIHPFKVKLPSSVHNDLYENGFIDDPFFETNNLKSEWVENRCWVYRARFLTDAEEREKKNVLVLEGVNNECAVYLNGEKAAHHFNVNTPLRIDLGGRLQENNELIIAVFKVCEEQNQMGRTSLNRFQTQRFGYGWDFATRMVGVGIHKDVYIESCEKGVLGDVFVHTSLAGEEGTVIVEGDFAKGTTLRVCFDERIAAEYPAGESFRAELAAGRVKKWYPINYGDQRLYPVRLTLLHNGKVEDELNVNVGFRTLSYIRSQHSAPDSLPYTVVINGEKIWLCGVNVLNFSHLLGAVKDCDYEFYFGMMRRLNINFIRWWGGGALEKQIFYDLADRYGILVWQDFTVSSSGTDSFPSADEGFLDELYKSAKQAVLESRNHVSTIAYCGGNELRGEDFHPIGYAHPLIARLGEIAKKYNPYIFFHSSTPSGKNFNFIDGEQHNREHANANVHGQYAYLGTKEHYAYYNAADYNFQGEFGCNGCCDEDTLAKFMSLKAVEGYREAGKDMNWVNRNSGWYNCYPRDCELFGKENMQRVGAFCAASQLIQAEGVRYIIERNRNRSFECSGCAIWQLNEPWPNSNCTTMIDYGKKPKMVSYFAKTAYSPVSVNLSYPSLVCEKGAPLALTVHLSTFVRDFNGVVRVRIVGGKGFDQQYKVRAEKQAAAEQVAVLNMDNAFGDVFFVRLSAVSEGKTLAENVYVFASNTQTPFAPLYKAEAKLTAFYDKQSGELVLKNEGSDPVLFIDIEGDTPQSFFAEDNFVSVFAGETVRVKAQTDGELFKLKDLTRRVALRVAAK